MTPEESPTQLPLRAPSPSEGALTTPAHKPPALVSARKLDQRSWIRIGALAAVLLVALIVGVRWWNQWQARLPTGIMFGNGRIEADEIDIDTKYAGRIAELLADEGDMLAAGQVVARMDTKDLAASEKKAQAQVRQAQKAIDEADANVVQQTAQVVLAQQEMDRAAALVVKGFQSKEVVDQRRQQLDGATAALDAAKARVFESQHALDAATHDVELYGVQIADNTLVAPRAGRIQYRIANIGEVLPAGGKVFTMLDISYVYMDIYLPTEEAGKVKFGADARILLDAYRDHPIPAKVSFIATQAQFTPKPVETQNERDKLMFRIRVRIDPDRLRSRGDSVRSGLPGVAYIRTDPSVAWPAGLQGTLAQ